jgi:hypothetical protein
MIDKNYLLRYELRPEDLSPSSHMRARNTAPSSRGGGHATREPHLMPQRTATVSFHFYVGPHFHGYRFFRIESHLDTRSILENPLLCSG